ncbi:Internalin-I [Listeria monocytogenes N53-1]|nr:Internalin-I [Listeria monocytogenes N53-1]
MGTITMSGNNLVGSIPDFTPALKQLYMSDMLITSDEIPNFNNIPLLITLDLSSNQLTTIPDFQNLPNLVFLDLNANLLTNTPDFQNLPKLADLNLGQNNLTGTMVNYTNLPSLNH